MTQDEIISMAQEAGFLTKCFNSVDGDEIVVQHSSSSFVWIGDELERFAALVRANTVAKCVEACDMQALKEKDYGFDPLQRNAYRQGLLNCGGALWEILK